MSTPDTSPLAGISDDELVFELGVTREAIRLWRRGKRLVSPKHAVSIERRWGVPRHLLRPDVYAQPVEVA